MPNIQPHPKELKEHLPHGTLELAYSIYHTNAKAPLILYQHWHEECEFLVIEEGHTTFQTGTHFFDLSAGDAVFIPPYCLHKAVSDICCSFYAIVFQPSFLIEDSSSYLFRQYISPVYHNPLANVCLFHGSGSSPPLWEKEISSSILRLCRSYISTPYTSPLIIKAELLTCWQSFFQHMLYRKKTQEDPRISETLRFLRLHFHEEITVTRLAKQAGLSEGQLSRIFKQQTGLSMITYLNRIRLTRACQLLTEKDTSISDIAFSCGFRNLSNFNRLFRKNLYCSPLTYRRQKDRLKNNPQSQSTTIEGVQKS